MFSPILFRFSQPNSYLLLLFFFSYFHHFSCALSQREDRTCDPLFKCGNITAGFPFWGVARPGPCGLDSYHETCGGSFNITVPISYTPEDEALNVTNLKFVRKKGFKVKLRIDEIQCQTCKSAGGICAYDVGTPLCCKKDSSLELKCAPMILSKSSAKNGTFQPPSESQPSNETPAGTKKKTSKKLQLILGVLAAFISAIIIVVAVTVTTKNMRKDDWNDKKVEAVVMLKRYSYESVKKMTNSFVHVLGKGGFGTVYKGKLPDSGQDVAVKILKETEGNGQEFINEVASMSRTSHVNIVSLLGFCYERNKRAIIYEFMPNGSLDKFISKNMSTRLDWERLYNIFVGISRGLEYLHNRCVSRIVHFDIKPQNILIDEKFCPKISDFGLAKLCKNKEESIISMLDARGTVGYIAPEVYSKNFGGASHKSDVYSYGMVVLEMIGARDLEKVKNAQSNNSSVYFPDWIYKDFEQGKIMRMFGDQVTEEEERIAKKLVLVGLWCIQMNPFERPPMIKVIEMLEGSLEALEVPPKPLLFVHAATVPETLEDSNETSCFSNPSQFERSILPASEDVYYSKEIVQATVGESQLLKEALNIVGSWRLFSTVFWRKWYKLFLQYI